jgi:hypothetical protein
MRDDQSEPVANFRRTVARPINELPSRRSIEPLSGKDAAGAGTPAVFFGFWSGSRAE